MKLFLFEIKKLMWTKKYWIIFSVCIVAVVGLFVRNMLLQDYAVEEKRSEYNAYIKVSEMNETSYELQLKRVGKDEEIEQLREMNMELLNMAIALRNVFTPTNWREWLQLESDYLQKTQEFKLAGGEHSLSERRLRIHF
ncbi:hypothetical protein [Paracerasibacillus soli]|uniref:Uncharacterized protein n=1 Tax=Paracerasibacillus soli TaxID=480284 RepID=A0ABU5CNF8_9BACI|nr:hypothetical protein [Virgibacillus soli]MDY0407899.1 hypothetical protein [Virgibacillus soli]